MIKCYLMYPAGNNGNIARAASVIIMIKLSRKEISGKKLYVFMRSPSIKTSKWEHRKWKRKRIRKLVINNVRSFVFSYDIRSCPILDILELEYY